MEKNKITIHYCAQCRFILRATWLAQELLMTFPEEIQELALRPGSNGVFEVWINESLIHSKKDMGNFPESKELKQMIRDVIAPDKYLGHSDID